MLNISLVKTNILKQTLIFFVNLRWTFARLAKIYLLDILNSYFGFDYLDLILNMAVRISPKVKISLEPIDGYSWDKLKV